MVLYVSNVPRLHKHSQQVAPACTFRRPDLRCEHHMLARAHCARKAAATCYYHSVHFITHQSFAFY